MTIEAQATFATPRHLAGQGALLFMGFGASQGLSFVRNAIMGHALSKDNFGIAATITLILQMIETLSDLGADRLIVQADDGDQPGFLASAHTLLVARGLLLGCILFIAGPLLAQFFGAGHAAAAFQLAALVPAIKGFVHLDYRVAQRRFDNRPQMLVEVLPQAVALLIVLPVLAATRDYTAAVSLSLAQAVAVVVLSHVMAKGSYALGFESAILKRQLAFGWPILASSLPLIAVYQGDRLIIGHLSGMEALAGYTVAFMVTMVPGLIAAKVGHSLMLPVFSDALRRGKSLLPKFKIATEGTVVFAALYLAGFVVCGDALLPLVFGSHYANLGSVTAWLAAMWALRMIQAVPGMALMAHGETKPFFVAGVLRALALPCVLWAATHGASIATMAAIGFAFEALSLAYVTLRLEKLECGLGTSLFVRAGFLVPAALVACLAASATHATPAISIFSAAAVVLAIGASGLTIMPSLNALLRRALQSRAFAAVI
jgi:O-antigen/teichoic acid export membrane protein